MDLQSVNLFGCVFPKALQKHLLLVSSFITDSAKSLPTIILLLK